MTNRTADAPALLTEAELDAVSGGIHIMPKSPPFTAPQPPGSGGDPLPPPGGYIP